MTVVGGKIATKRSYRKTSGRHDPRIGKVRFPSIASTGSGPYDLPAR
jgi:hypothetical protein